MSSEAAKTYTLKRSSKPEAPEFDIDYRAELNEQQYEAVTHSGGPLLVIAGAGSGKTRTLIYRLAYLIESGLSPKSILLLTFTKKSAQEMTRRATQLLDERCDGIKGGTFHSFANLTLRKYAARVGFESNFTIVDRPDAEDIINLSRSELGFSSAEGKRFPKKRTILNVISKSTNTGKTFEELLERDYPKYLDDEPAIRKIADHYRSYKQTNGLMDYDDLLIHLRNLLADNEDIRSKLSRENLHILIDEYQDTNALQSEVAELLCSEHQNIMAVGDDCQSIYSFRGANFRNIMDFPKRFSDCKIVTMEQNYRSTQPLLAFSNAIIKTAKEKYSKELFSNIEGQDKPVYIRSASISEQAEFICQKVLELREEGVPLKKIAVLFRSGWHSNELEVELSAQNIPFVKYGGMKFVEAAHVKDLVSLVRLIYNPKDSISWYRMLLLLEGIGPKTARRILSEVVEKEQGADALLFKEFTKNKYGGELKKLYQAIDQFQEHDGEPAKQIGGLLKFYQPLLKQHYDDHKKRANDLDSLIRIAERYKKIDSFLSDITLEPPDESQIATTAEEKEDEKLILSTVHSAKGLEWHSAFIINLVDGFLPAAQSLDTESETEEERRLFYVACTRAQKHLWLITPELNRSYGYSPFRSGFTFALPSRFLSDIEDFQNLTEEWVLSKE